MDRPSKTRRKMRSRLNSGQTRSVIGSVGLGGDAAILPKSLLCRSGRPRITLRIPSGYPPDALQRISRSSPEQQASARLAAPVLFGLGKPQAAEPPRLCNVRLTESYPQPLPYPAPHPLKSREAGQVNGAHASSGRDPQSPQHRLGGLVRLGLELFPPPCGADANALLEHRAE
jgi:hypothetical protein